MSGEFLVDTNVAIAFQAGESAVVKHFADELILLPSITVGELFYGAYNSTRQMVNVAAVDNLCKSVTVISCDYDTGRFYGLIKGSLRARGKKIPDNDIWIAALARQHDLTLATRDAHFSFVNELRIESW